MLKTALIVDDSRLARLTLKRLLAKYDIEVAEAESVVDGENWIARHHLHRHRRRCAPDRTGRHRLATVAVAGAISDRP